MIADFLQSAAAEPSALIIEGDPGIGKSTLWMAGTQLADQLGFRVLTASPAAAESVLAYASLADMLSVVDLNAIADLPNLQRLALQRMLLRANGNDPTDQRAVAAGFLSAVNAMNRESSVLLAIDDLQWIDTSSRLVIAFVARRLRGGVGVLCTVRADANRGAPSWLQLPRPDSVRRMELAALSSGGLREIISTRLGRSLPRSTMERIHEISRGNPYYALELARMTAEATDSEVHLPNSLAELVRARIEGLDMNAKDALLAACCVAAPTVELVARATDTDVEHVVSVLADAEDAGIVEIAGHRLFFTHPLLARGVYNDALSARRRAMHRRLAEIEEEPELQARHLAMAVAWGEPHTLECLDKAAQKARLRGAPAAAAELIDLALGLGGDTDERRIQSASHHLDAGDFEQARILLEQAVKQMAPGATRAAGVSLLARMRLLDGRFAESANLLEGALAQVEGNLAQWVPMMVTLAMALFNVGRRADAIDGIEEAVTGADRLAHPHLLSQALSMREMLRIISGGGLDEDNVRRALELEDRRAAGPVIFRPSAQSALFVAWTGRLDEARNQMDAVRRRCVERGEESELIFVAVHSMLIDIWRGDFVAASVTVDEAMERAQQLGGEGPLSTALMMRAAVGAYAGRVDDARRDVADAQVAADRSYSYILAALPATILGFLETSLGNYEAASTALAPMVAKLLAAPEGTEIYVAGFVPDAVEALVHLGRPDDAEPLVDALESNGRRLNRAWMLAVGSRCRSLLLAARGNLHAAHTVVRQAMAHHERLAMPFERARTQLMLGQLQRRQRQKDAAAKTLCEAVASFEQMGTPLWANRARAELARTGVGRSDAAGLTASERSVAELAASGMTNRDVAAALFISPKTVEANLARIYRKLDIHTRAELGRIIGGSDIGQTG